MSEKTSTTGTMPFGQYRGMPIETLVARHPGYVRWLLAETDIEHTHRETFIDIEARLEILKLYRLMGLL